MRVSFVIFLFLLLLPAVEPSLPYALYRQFQQLREEPGLSWQSILAFSAILFAGMQGTLALESSDPCRLSKRKLVYFLALEFFEFVVAIVAELFSFFELRSAFQVRLQWLSWLPYCFLVHGVIVLITHVCYSLYVAFRSYCKWIPICSVDQHSNRLTSAVKLTSLVISAALSFVLVGWRQRWWIRTSSFSSAEESFDSTSGERFLCVGVMVFCIIWALLLLLIVSVLCLFFRDELCDVLYNAGLIERTSGRMEDKTLKVMDNIKTETGSSVRRAFQWQNIKKSFTFNDLEEDKEVVMNQRRLLHIISTQPELEIQKDAQSGQEYVKIWWKRAMCASSDENTNVGNDGEQVQAAGHSVLDDIDKCVESRIDNSPLNVRNAILGAYKEKLTRSEKAGVVSIVLVIAKHASLLPLLICVVASVARLRNRVDSESFETLKKLGNVVIVVSAVEIAVNLKLLIWGIQGTRTESYASQNSVSV